MVTETIPSTDTDNSAGRLYNPARNIGRATAQLANAVRDHRINDLPQEQAHEILMCIASARDLVIKAVGESSSSDLREEALELLHDVSATADLLANDCQFDSLRPGTLTAVSARILYDTERAIALIESPLSHKHSPASKVSSVRPVPD